MTKGNFEKQKFQELLPMYVNKTLEYDEIAFVERYLELNPEMKSQVKLNEAIRETIQKNREAYSDQIELGWQKLYQRIQADKNKKGLFAWGRVLNNEYFRLVASVSRWGVMSPAFGFIFVLFIGQALYVVNLQNEASKYRGIVNSVNTAPHFKVTVSPKADFYDLADLLRKNGCNVVSGPSQNGELWVKLDEPAKSKQIKADLLNSGLVDEVISVSPAVE